MTASIKLKRNGPQTADHCVVLAHGAGAPMDSPFMEYFAKQLAKAGIRVVRFEFPYMAKRRETGKKTPPDRLPKLEASWLDVIGRVSGQRIVIGGKSMGGRVASLVADEAQVSGLVCLGYPFHPVGKPDRLRTEHLQDFKTPTLIVQGERDVFGNASEVPRYRLSDSVELCWVPDGDHSFKPRKSSGHTEAENLAIAAEAVTQFVRSL